MGTPNPCFDPGEIIEKLISGGGEVQIMKNGDSNNLYLMKWSWESKECICEECLELNSMYGKILIYVGYFFYHFLYYF